MFQPLKHNFDVIDLYMVLITVAVFLTWGPAWTLIPLILAITRELF